MARSGNVVAGLHTALVTGLSAFEIDRKSARVRKEVEGAKYEPGDLSARTVDVGVLALAGVACAGAKLHQRSPAALRVIEGAIAVGTLAYSVVAEARIHQASQQTLAPEANPVVAA